MTAEVLLAGFLNFGNQIFLVDISSCIGTVEARRGISVRGTMKGIV